MPLRHVQLRRAAYAVLLPGLAAIAPALGAQSPSRDSRAADTVRTHAPPAAPRFAPTFAVHGYLTQGWGRSSGTPFYGLTDRSSTDFRYAALQGRYSPSASDMFLLQLNHRRLGHSQITDFESDLNVDWAFYQRTFHDGTSLRVGRVPIPRGIYNELRSVGVALPMYRPPVVFYDEGAYYSETIDGLVASHTFGEDAPWSLEVHAYAGGWRSLAYDVWSSTYSVSQVRATNAIGSQVWLSTPISGVRVGGAWQRYDYDPVTVNTSKVSETHVSFDATRERGFVRVEAQRQNYGTDNLYSGYAQFGARLVDKLSATIELQRARDGHVNFGTLPHSYEWHRSDGLGLSYALSPNLVLKIEHHRDRGIQVEQPSDVRHPPRFSYTLASVSTSF